MNFGVFGVFSLIIGLLSFSFETAVALGNQIQGQSLLTGKTEIYRVGHGKKALVVIFLSVNCPSSQAHISEVKSLAAKFTDFQFVILHANQDEAFEKSQKYFKEQDLGVPVLEDKKAQYADILRAAKTPHATILNAAGETLYQGGITNSGDPNRAQEFFLRQALQDLNGNKPVQISEGRTLGCLINRGEKNVW